LEDLEGGEALMADQKQQEAEERSAFERETGKKYGLAEVDNFLKWKKQRKVPPAVAPVPLTPPPGAPPPISAGAGATQANITNQMTPQARLEERNRAKTEAGIQSQLDKAKFLPPERANPYAGLSIMEIAQVDALVRQGVPLADAIKQIKPVKPVLTPPPVR
jgi:hypothetical protein